MTRLAVTTGLDAWDIPALRFGVAGLLMLPIVIRHGLSVFGVPRLEPRTDDLLEIGDDAIGYSAVESVFSVVMMFT